MKDKTNIQNEEQTGRLQQPAVGGSLPISVLLADRHMEEIEAYHLNWLWTARRYDGQGSWHVITHADDERTGKTACGMDSSRGWWDGSGENITKAAPSCLKCCRALAKKGIIHNPDRISGGMVVIQNVA